MRILALGLGGAGGRIVNQLYQADRRSSKVACVQALVVDVDSDSIAKLSSLPDKSKIFFPSFDLAHNDEMDSEKAAMIEISEITSKVQTMAGGETDAIFLFVGLGGTMADAAPNIITALRASMTEPIFALVTLPCLSEGKRISAKAADDIEMIAPLLDGVIIFDNETWHKKVKVSERIRPSTNKGVASLFGLTKKKEPELSPTERMYLLLNDAIVRRISLILRAGEFRADGGLDLAEVVLDSGEVLNTMRGMGFITIGYAVEQLPTHPFDFLGRLRPSGYLTDEHMKKASRIIDLAKQAIYHEVSAPCDITSAHKALILIAGPSHELSMKGYMTVRKWIDRSIAGLETRSGDYPVTSTKFVAIIIMLSGLENIPRLQELKEIRAHLRAHVAEPARISEISDYSDTAPSNVSGKIMRDEMITLPSEKKRPVFSGQPSLHPRTKYDDSISPSSRVTSANRIKHSPAMHGSAGAEQPEKSTITKGAGVQDSGIKKHIHGRSAITVKEGRDRLRKEPAVVPDTERRRIELELQKQRELAIQGIREPDRHETRVQRSGSDSPKKQVGAEIPMDGAAIQKSQIKQVIVKKQMAKKVIIHKKTGLKDEDTSMDTIHEGSPFPQEPAPHESGSSGQTVPEHATTELLDTWIRQVAGQKKRYRNEESEALRIGNTLTVARDDALLHTDLKREKPGKENHDRIADSYTPAQPQPNRLSEKKQRNTQDEDDHP
ncbi:MAG: cell division protein FtsZ [Methanoregula sp. PtaU1.Bin051]|nr:MAG: cell division protein FtsZ [Methanoregula sp. PtaU1.Bin051]